MRIPPQQWTTRTWERIPSALPPATCDRYLHLRSEGKTGIKTSDPLQNTGPEKRKHPLGYSSG